VHINTNGKFEAPRRYIKAMKKLAEIEKFDEIYGYDINKSANRLDSIFARIDNPQGIIKESIVKRNMFAELIEYYTTMAASGNFKDIEYDIAASVDMAFNMGYESIIQYIKHMKTPLRADNIAADNPLNIPVLNKMLSAA
jgi:hypothetical protein